MNHTLVLAVLVVLVIAAVAAVMSRRREDPLPSVSTPPLVGASQASVITPEPLAVGLFDITEANTPDKRIAIGMKLWGKKYGYDFPVVNIGTSISFCREALERLYQEGYRVFVGMNSSTMLAGVLPWFLEHADAVGISVNSASSSLNVPKNVIRLTNNNAFRMYYASVFAQRYPRVLVIAVRGDLLIRESVEELVRLMPRKTQVLEIDAVEGEEETILRALASVGTDTLVIPLIQEGDVAYFSLLPTLQEGGGTIPVQLDVIGGAITPSPELAPFLSDKLYVIGVVNDLSFAVLEYFRLLSPLGLGHPYVLDTFNIMRLSCLLGSSVYPYVDALLGHAGTLELNTNNDRKYGNFTIEVYRDGLFHPTYLYGFNPTLGRFESRLQSTSNADMMP